jgi:hypothetical protein
MKLTTQKISGTYAVITLALVSFLGYVTQAKAQPTVTANNLSNSRQMHFAQLKLPNILLARHDRKVGRVRFVLPRLPDTGAPIGRQKGAATRGNCSAVDSPLTALVPAVEQTLDKGQGKTLTMTNVWGSTIAQHPAFWFYVPYSHTSAHSSEFVLQDEAGNDVYRTPVMLPERPGVVSFHLPTTSAPLAVGKMYHWYFKVYCNPQKASNPINPVFVEGWVQRVTLNPGLTSQLAAATPQQQIALYAANGIWYEALTSLAELRLVEPNDAALKADWADLLRSVNLDNITSKPIVRCCVPRELKVIR